VRFEWDPRKARANRTKHGVAFADAVGAFEDDRALTIRDESPDEERWLTTGADFLGRVLVICYTIRGEAIRLISARKATGRERKEYDS
jgi:hypothetical protein